MTRTERLFALAEALRARRSGVTAEELAERFGVSLRTIYRDLTSLRQADLPLAAERGRGGGYALDRSYTLPPVNLSPREAAVLVRSGEHLLAMRMMPFARTLASALDKVRGALGKSAQRELSERLRSVEMVGVPLHDVDPRVREAVEQAWFEQRPLRVRYLSPEHVESERVVWLRQVVIDRAEILLNVDDVSRGPRQLKLHRLLAAELVDDAVAATSVSQGRGREDAVARFASRASC
ncbi:MAG: HTH domain-containing protein [Polyangiales bacterium]